jgi:uncharacterized protein (TIGR00730 family)
MATAKHPMHSPDDRMDKPRRVVCVFCGSSFGNDPAFAQAAQRLGNCIAENGYRLVFGAGNIGLMGETARAARDAGAPVIGVLPAFLRHLEPPIKSAEELIVVPDLFQRKDRMIALADAFVLLPGGMGTMDEFFEVITAAQLGRHEKPVVLVNLARYFDPLEALLRHMVKNGFAQQEVFTLYRMVATVDEAMAVLGKSLPSP